MNNDGIPELILAIRIEAWFQMLRRAGVAGPGARLIHRTSRVGKIHMKWLNIFGDSRDETIAARAAAAVARCKDIG